MKEFVKMTLAVMCGLFLMGIVGFFLLISAVGSLIAAAGSSSSTVVLPREGVLAMDMSKYSFVEVANPNTDFQALLQGQEIITPVSIWSAVQAVRKAAQDPGVKFLYLKPDGMSIGLAQLQELRAALEEFRASGKAVIAYTETPTTATLWLSSVADKVYLDSYCGTNGMVHGLSTQLIFVKDLLDKLGVNVQLIRHGKYKSAGEMFIRNSASPENLEQNQVLVNSMWKTISTDIAQGRGIETEQLDKAISELKLQFPADFLALNLVDSLTTREQLKQRLAVLSGKESFYQPFYADTGSCADAPRIFAEVVQDNTVHGHILVFWNGEPPTEEDFHILSLVVDAMCLRISSRIKSMGSWNLALSTKLEDLLTPLPDHAAGIHHLRHHHRRSGLSACLCRICGSGASAALPQCDLPDLRQLYRGPLRRHGPPWLWDTHAQPCLCRQAFCLFRHP